VTTGERIEALRGTFRTAGWQDIIVPATQQKITDLEQHWLNGTRDTGDEKLTDEALKGRIWAMAWMMAWPKRTDTMAANFEAQQAKLAETEDHSEGASSYS